MDIRDIRKQNLAALAANYDTQREFAEAVGIDASFVSQLLTGHRSIGERLARRLEKNALMESGALDQLTEQNKVREQQARYQQSAQIIGSRFEVILHLHPRVRPKLLHIAELLRDGELTEADLDVLMPLINRLAEKE